MAVYEVRVSLIGAEPPVWRRVRVPVDARLSLVHRLLQMVMGWENSHLHEFVANDRKRYGAVGDGNGDVELQDESRYELSTLLGKPGDRCLYVYDFGDDWVHELVLESVSDIAPEELPVWCLEGAGACPPEDCGGLPGYAELLESLRDRTDSEHAYAIEVLGEDFNAGTFDCTPFNDRVREMFADGARHLVPEEMTEGKAVLMGLRDFLESEGMPERTMSVVGLDGFFSALAIHPETLMPEVWLPWVWDVSGAGSEPEFSSKAELEEGLGLLFTFYNSVVRQFTDDSEAYRPLFQDLEFESEEDRMLAVQDWASGFMLGVMIEDGVWDRTFRDKKGNLLLAPFAMVSGMFDDVGDIEPEKLAAMKDELSYELGLCVLDLQKFWEPWRQEYLSGQEADPESGE